MNEEVIEAAKNNFNQFYNLFKGYHQNLKELSE